MHITKLAFVLSLLAGAAVANAQSSMSAFPDASPPPEAVKMATAVGYSLGAMPEMQRKCGHTAEQKRRVERVSSFLEQKLAETGGPSLGTAYRDGQKAAATQTAGFLSKLGAADVQAACAKLNSDFDSKLKSAEANIPADFMPATKVAPSAPGKSGSVVKK